MKNVRNAPRKKNANTFTVNYLRSIRGEDELLLEPTRQIAFIGRSNAGKSSTLNALFDTDTAKVSRTPGKTRALNIYEAKRNKERYFVIDLPGYGYSELRGRDHEQIRKWVLWYLTRGGRPEPIVLVIDGTIPPTEFDQEAVSLAHEVGHSIIILANKLDRLNQKERHANLKIFEEVYRGTTIIPWSAKTEEGKEKIMNLLFPPFA